MSRCPDNTDWVLYAAEELPPRRRSTLAAHLETCAACRREAASLGRGLSALKILEREPAVRPLALETLRNRLRAAAAHKAARPAWVVRLSSYRWAAAAAVLLLAALAWTLWPSAPWPPTLQQTPSVARDDDVSEQITEAAVAIEMLETNQGSAMDENGNSHSEATPADTIDEMEMLLDTLSESESQG